MRETMDRTAVSGTTAVVNGGTVSAVKSHLHHLRQQSHHSHHHSLSLSLPPVEEDEDVLTNGVLTNGQSNGGGLVEVQVNGNSPNKTYISVYNNGKTEWETDVRATKKLIRTGLVHQTFSGLINASSVEKQFQISLLAPPPSV